MSSNSESTLPKIKLWIFLFGLWVLSASCSNDEPQVEGRVDIETQLGNLEGVTSVNELATEDHFVRLFEIDFEQPVDHNNVDGPKFSQKLFLGHVDEHAPLVFETEGYGRRTHRTRELAPMLTSNQLAVEHRYFGTSVPSSGGTFEFLNIWQAANDHHRIVEAFKSIYDNGWVSSGASKGGDAAIFHRRFFPLDVDATVAYVAPILFEQRDQRFLEFYNTSGDEDCREKLIQFQRNILLKIDSIPPLFEAYVESVGDFGDATTFSLLNYKDIVYNATRIDYLFEFWSSETENCSTIPGEDASAQELLDHFVGVFDVFLFFSDFGVNFWTPYCYQALTELGNYAYDASHLEDFELDIPELTQFSVSTDFDPSAMADIQNWISSSASEMIFIYGEDDPWTVAAVNHPGSNQVLKIINPSTKHGTRIVDLSMSDQNLVLGKIMEWIGL